jgi:hypothetical protein
VLLLLCVALGLVAGLATGGSLDNFARLRVHWPWVAVGALVVREASVITPLRNVNGIQYVYTLALALLVVWCIWNVRRLRGLVILTAGAAVNLLVVVANGGRMPVAASVASIRGNVGQYTVMSSSTRLNWLGDWIGLPAHLGVYSPGDVIIAAGIFVVAALASHAPKTPIDTPNTYSGLTPP